MTAGLLLYIALTIALAALTGWALETLLRQLGRPARWAWLAASVMAVLLTLRAALATSSVAAPATYPRLMLPSASTVASPDWSPLLAVREALALSAAAIASATEAIARVVPRGMTSILVTAWIVASLIALVLLAFVHLRIRRARHGWAEANLFGTRVRIAPDVGPAVVGVICPQIVVPSWLLGRSTDEQQLVLAHEREHLGARDHLLLGAESLIVALVPWHPAAWWMLARLRLAIELDCDARVLRRGVPARTYGTLLIDLADRCTGFRVGATALADEGSHLERRLLAMKTNGTKRSLLRAGVLGAAAALAVLAACEAKVPTGPEIEAMDVAGASKAVMGTRMLQKSQMDSGTFIVDGREVDARTANALAPGEIATINIAKSKVSGKATIRIVTKTASVSSDSGLYISGAKATVQQGQFKIREPSAVSGTRSFAGLIFIDGVRVENSALQQLDPKSIESIEVIKGVSALNLSSDPAAKNGIIKVTTKK